MSSGTDSPNILFFGTEEFSLAALSALVENGFTVAAVITRPDSRRGRGLKIHEPAVKTYAREHGIPVWQPEKPLDIVEKIRSVQNRAGVLSAYGRIIPDALLDLFDCGITNVHPSLLPAYRGPSPIETALYNGDAVTGVSLIRLVSAMDAGPVYASRDVPLAHAGAVEAYQVLGCRGAELLVDHLPAIVSGDLMPRPQDDARATYTKLIRSSEALVDPGVQSAVIIERHVRAYAATCRTKIVFNDVSLIITDTHVVSRDENGFVIPCADDTYLAIDGLITPNGRSMSGDAFKNGYLRD